MTAGKRGEMAFRQYMIEKGYDVVDVSNSSDYWYKDIDFIITSPTSGLTKTFECKWDSRINQTNNLFIEIANPRSKGGQGWFSFCEADFIAYGNATRRIFYMIKKKDLDDVMKNKHRFRYCITADGAEGYLVPLDAIEYQIL